MHCSIMMDGLLRMRVMLMDAGANDHVLITTGVHNYGVCIGMDFCSCDL